ncbi:MAG: hypothetical protein ACKOS8_10870, partial [Gemmataceae bacterium]
MPRLTYIFMALLAMGAPGLAQSATPTLHDFSKGLGTWKPNPSLSLISTSPDGVRLLAQGPDPFLIGPPADYPAGQPVTVT